MYEFVSVFDLIWHRHEIHKPDSELKAEPREGYEHEYHFVLRHVTVAATEILDLGRKVGEYIEVDLAMVQIADLAARERGPTYRGKYRTTSEEVPVTQGSSDPPPPSPPPSDDMQRATPIVAQDLGYHVTEEAIIHE